MSNHPTSNDSEDGLYHFVTVFILDTSLGQHPMDAAKTLKKSLEAYCLKRETSISENSYKAGYQQGKFDKEMDDAKELS